MPFTRAPFDRLRRRPTVGSKNIGPLLRAALAASCALVASKVVAQSSQEPPVDILMNGADVAAGLIFLTPVPASRPLPNAPSSTGPEIVDNLGRPVWFVPLTSNESAADLRVQTYNSQEVLTWSQGAAFGIPMPSITTDYICDNTYKVIATVQAGNGLNADGHEFLISPQNTALIPIYSNVTADESSVGGPVKGTVQEGVVQEIDIPTGNVLFEWHSLDHVPLTESYMPVPTTAGAAYDYFHINSISVDTDGNLIISSRHTWTLYKVNRTTGAVMWRLGGKKSDFALGAGLPFAWQHNAVVVDASTIRIFDNESDGAPVLPASRVIWVKHDDVAMTASVVESLQHPSGLSVIAEGNAQALSNGDTFVDWGFVGHISEFDPSGALIYDASLPGYSSYRGYRFPWVAKPAAPPAAIIQQNADGTTTVHAVWNGATEVATWQVMGGSSSTSLSLLASAPWSGLDTPVQIPAAVGYIQVVALNAAGEVIGTSASGGVTLSIVNQPVAQTIAKGGTAIFSISASDPAATFQWALNGVPLSDGAHVSGSNSSQLMISGATSASAGAYSCIATDSGAVVQSVPASLAVSTTEDVGRLINLSCRAQVGTGSNVLITGFVVGPGSGSGSEPLLIRASGPALAPFGISGFLPDPALQLVATTSGSANPIASNTGWAGSAAISSAASSVGAFPWTDVSSPDSALLQSLGTGSYTAKVSDATGASGVALTEIYDATAKGTYTPSLPRLTNISARAQVGTGAGILVAGFVIGGSTSRTVLIRASGPALAPFIPSGTLPDPQLQLYSTATGGSMIASNSGWSGNPEVAAAISSTGAFPWTSSSSHDAAILITLPPGSYTANVAGQSGDSGVALVEVYEVP